IAVPGPLTIGVPSGTQTVNGASLVVAGVSISDPSIGSTDNVTLTLSVAHGSLSLATTVSGGLTSDKITGNGTGSVTVVAPLAAINATLADASGLTYTPTAGFNGGDTLNLSASDPLNNTNTASVTITVPGPLTIGVPNGTQTVNGASLVVAGVSLADPSLPESDNVTLTLSVAHGSLSLATTVSGGLTSEKITGNGTGSVTVVAPLAAINATLADASGLTYTPTAGFNGGDTLNLSASDPLNNTNTASVTIAVPGPLTIGVPSGTQTVNGASLVVAGVSISDPSIGSTDNVTLTLAVADGSLSLATTV